MLYLKDRLIQRDARGSTAGSLPDTVGHRSVLCLEQWKELNMRCLLAMLNHCSLKLKTVWYVENVSLPVQLRNVDGIAQLMALLKEHFATVRKLRVHSVKLACCWPEEQSPFENLLGWLSTIGGVETMAGACTQGA